VQPYRNLVENLVDRLLDGFFVLPGRSTTRRDEVTSVDFKIGGLATHLLNPRFVDDNLSTR
jgi:hypothetical protein